ncbi:MAG: hypothetical protein AAF074_17565 [Pseudomonadota bacterium]
MKLPIGAAALSVLFVSSMPAMGDDLFGFELSGSLREGGFERYVPPVTNPLFNETPFITTEAKPLYIYHRIPDGFVSNGGTINVAALQLRLALTERFAFIATSDGYSNLDFEDVLEDDDGPNDVAFGVKYAVHYDPAGGSIATAGLRYTAPAGNLSTGPLELNGTGNGFLNPFVTGAYILGDLQLQGSVGAQISLSEDNWSFVHLSGHADYQVIDNLFPYVEFNLFAPFDGGNQIVGGPLSNLTGAEIADIGASDPVTYLTLGGGARYRITDNAIAGLGIEGNLLNRDDTVFGLRVTADLVLHF